jgi:hypothetical protein
MLSSSSPFAQTERAIPRWRVRARQLLLWGAGLCEGLLLARLLAQLLAARPDNPVFQGLYAVSAPLIRPLAFLDVQQPRFGAVLELSTLTMLILVPLLSYLIWLLLHPTALRATSPHEAAS